MFHLIYFLTLGAITKLKYFLKHEKRERFLESEKNDKKTLSARKSKNGFKSLSRGASAKNRPQKESQEFSLGEISE